MSWLEKRKFKRALDCANSNELMRLCSELQSDLELRYRGLKQTITHHVARWPVSLDCLKLLIDRFGPNCLARKNQFGHTPVHLAARFKDDTWMMLIQDTLGNGCFEAKTNENETVTHYAAMNRESNKSLKWLVKELGNDCLTKPDAHGNTAVHFAALYQKAETLQFLTDRLGPSILHWKNNRGETLADWVDIDPRRILKRNWIASQHRMLESSELHSEISTNSGGTTTPCQSNETRPLPSPPETQQQQQQEQQQYYSSAELDSQNSNSLPTDPNFTSWNFVKLDGKLQILGEGNFSKVYKALTDRYQIVAVKVVRLNGGSERQKTEIKMEKRGIEILKSVTHPNIVKFLKCEVTAGGFCIFTELISGLSLFDLMKQQGKPIEESGVRNFSKQICTGLNFLHHRPQGPIIHRDIKCSNIMLTHDGIIKLIDFGLAKEIMSKSGLTTGNETRGTWHFMAPELFTGEEGSIPYSVKTDVWAFGCTVYEMTEMQPPNAGVSAIKIPIVMVDKAREMPQISDKFSTSLREFYRRCTIREPECRADTAELLRHSFLT